MDWVCGPLESLFGHLAIASDAVDAEVGAVEAVGDEDGGATAEKGVKDEAVLGAAGVNAGFDEGVGKDSEVGVTEF